MKIKRYVASSMEEALQDVKEELGQQAIILQTLRHKPVMGLFGKEKFEVVAATDAAFKVTSDRNRKKSLEDPGSNLASAQQSAPSPVHVPHVAARAYEGVTTAMPAEDPLENTDPAAVSTEEMGQNIDLLPVDAQIHDDLLAMGFQTSTVGYLLRESTDPESDAFADQLAKLAAVRYPKTPEKSQGNSRTVAVVGATGSGKTTTLARLAARAVSQGNRRVAFVTMDTSRVGAVEQLRSFGDILQAPCHVAYTGDDLKDALDRSADADLVLVDTAGTAPNDAVAIGRLRQALEQVEIDEIHLVMPVSTRLPDAQRLYQVYSNLRPNRLILTKLDETQALGGLLEIPQWVPLPVSYLTYGQRVPEDMEKATAEAVARRILGGLQALRDVRALP